MIAGPYIVTTKRNEGTRRFCDEVNINYAEKCSNYATVRMVGGRNDGMVFCTRHAPKRNRYAQAISDPVVLSRRAVATLDKARTECRDAIRSFYGARRFDDTARWALQAADELPESGGTVTLPDGTIIEVEATTWADLAYAAGLTYAAQVGARAEAGNAEARKRILDAYTARQETRA